MKRKSPSKTNLTRRTFNAGLGAAGFIAGTAPFNIVRAANAPLKVGVLLPRSGVQAGIGQDCWRGVEIAGPILKELGLPELQVMSGDTETKVDVARSRAEQLIGQGAQLLVGAFDSGQTTAIAQVAEQKGIPLVINIAAAPQITEQGYKFVFRNFPTATMILGDAFKNQKEVFAQAGAAPKTVVFMHVNDTFGTAMAKASGASCRTSTCPTRSCRRSPTIRRRATSRSRSPRPRRPAPTRSWRSAASTTPSCSPAKWSSSAGRRWRSSAWARAGTRTSISRRSASCPTVRLSFVPWYDPNKPLSKTLEAAMAKKYPGLNLNTNQVYTFEALLIAADAYKRAGTADPKALAEAIRKTHITNNVSPGAGIMFNAKGQNDKLKDSAIQNRGGKTGDGGAARWPPTPRSCGR